MPFPGTLWRAFPTAWRIIHQIVSIVDGELHTYGVFSDFRGHVISIPMDSTYSRDFACGSAAPGMKPAGILALCPETSERDGQGRIVSGDHLALSIWAATKSQSS